MATDRGGNGSNAAVFGKKRIGVQSQHGKESGYIKKAELLKRLKWLRYFKGVQRRTCTTYDISSWLLLLLQQGEAEQFRQLAKLSAQCLLLCFINSKLYNYVFDFVCRVKLGSVEKDCWGNTSHVCCPSTRGQCRRVFYASDRELRTDNCADAARCRWRDAEQHIKS